MTKWTGERLETHVNNDNATEHLHRYALAMHIAQNKVVLDIASGEGYGSKLISSVANKVIGVDISEETIQAARIKYKSQNLEFLVGSADAIPCSAAYFDLVVSFETLEHHDKHEQMMLEIKRVLKPDGVLIISTPDKKYYTDATNYNNPFHVKELYFNEFESLLSKHFLFRKFYFQKIVTGSLIIPKAGQESFEVFRGNYDAIDLKAEFMPLYNLAIASDNQELKIPSSFFDGSKLVGLAVENAIKSLKGSVTYRVGSVLLWPIKFLRSLYA